MSLNDGQVYLDFFDKKEEYKKMAEDFSEGDSLLKETLLKLWEKGIKTIACCKGHEDKSAPAYISFIMDHNSMETIQSTCDYLYMQDGDITLNFLNSEEDYNIFSIHMKTEEDKNKYLKFIQSILNKENENQQPNDIPFSARCLLAYARKLDMRCRYILTKEEMMFGYFKKGENLVFNGDMPQLRELLDSVVETGKLPLIPILCDKESLEQFINILYPNTFKNNKVKNL